MKSQILISKVWHARLSPIVHEFQYRVLMLSLDLSELPQIGDRMRLFSYNRFNLLSIFDKDFLDGSTQHIETRIRSFLSTRGQLSQFQSISLITAPRYFGYSFNPVSFYICRDQHSRISVVVAEVHNTFGETHLYVLERVQGQRDQVELDFKFAKEFYVSPFYDRAGEYSLRLTESEHGFNMKIDLSQNGERVFATTLDTVALPLRYSSLVSSLLRLPLAGVLTMLRIHLQAARLAYRHGVGLFLKPTPASTATIRSEPRGFWIALRLWLIRNGRACSKLTLD